MLVQHCAVNAKVSTLVALLLAQPLPAVAQVVGPQTSAGCVSVTNPRARVSVSGRLTLQLFPGPPNYESVAAGDTEERTFIIELPRAACIDDGGDFADTSEQFVTVRVSATPDALLAVLRASVGRHVTVSGEGFASHTGHHHAPLVVLVDRISVD